MLHWYLVHTKPGQEAIAQAHLERQGYETYLPRIAQAVMRRGRWRPRIDALFPGYLFLTPGETRVSLAPVRSTVGVVKLVRFGTEYATVPDGLVAAIRDREDADTGLHSVRRPTLPRAGSCVRIASGPFDGLEGVYQRSSGEQRAVVLLSLLGQNTRVCLPIEAILSGRAA